MNDFLTGLLRFRRGPWELLANVLIVISILFYSFLLFLIQPFVLRTFPYFVIVTLVGTVLFIIVRYFLVSDFLTGLLRLRRGPWELLASVLIAIGVVMLMQPFALWAFTYSFIVTLVGTVLFIIVSHFPD